MTQMSVELTDEQDVFVSAMVTDWDYPDANSVLRAAVVKMQADHDAKLRGLRTALQEGVDSGLYEGDPFEAARGELGWKS